MHEARLHDHSTFVTLTYDQEHIPHDFGLHWPDAKDFLRRVRHRFGSVRYFIAGEYGSQNLRPHWHAILFGPHFSDSRPTNPGSDLCVSKTLSELWTAGGSTLGSLTPGSASYVAKYSLKKDSRSSADQRYQRVDASTGEVYTVAREGARMSLRPGIGAGWYARYFRSDVYNEGTVRKDGKPVGIPRYYLKLLEREDPEAFMALKEKRLLKARTMDPDSTPDRLRAREAVAVAASAQRQRNL